MTDVRVRPATAADGPAIDRLLEQLLSDAGSTRALASPQERRAALPRLIATDRIAVLVAEASLPGADPGGVAIAGMISFSFNLALRYAGEYAQIEELIVDPRARGLKLGALLVRAAIDKARQRGCREIGLYAREETRAFYEKLGFRYAGPEVRLPLV